MVVNLVVVMGFIGGVGANGFGRAGSAPLPKQREMPTKQWERCPLHGYPGITEPRRTRMFQKGNGFFQRLAVKLEAALSVDFATYHGLVAVMGMMALELEASRRLKISAMQLMSVVYLIWAIVARDGPMKRRSQAAPTLGSDWTGPLRQRIGVSSSLLQQCNT